MSHLYAVDDDEEINLSPEDSEFEKSVHFSSWTNISIIQEPELPPDPEVNSPARDAKKRWSQVRRLSSMLFREGRKVAKPTANKLLVGSKPALVQKPEASSSNSGKVQQKVKKETHTKMLKVNTPTSRDVSPVKTYSTLPASSPRPQSSTTPSPSSTSSSLKSPRPSLVILTAPRLASSASSPDFSVREEQSPEEQTSPR